MARYTSAYSSFVARLEEVETLRRFAGQKERRDAVTLRGEINALCRGSVVLLSAHLEAYIKELGELALDAMHSKAVDRGKVSSRLYYHISKHILDEIRDTTDHDKIAEKVFGFIQTDLSFWCKTGPFPQPILAENFNKGFSNPAYDKIKSYINRFGYEDYSKDLGRKMERKYQPAINMVDHLVDTRNKIAHGDLTATKTPQEIKQMIDLVRSYCQATDDVFAKWWKTNFCSLR